MGIAGGGLRVTGRNGRGLRGGGVGGRCSILTLRRVGEHGWVLGESVLVKDVDTRKIGCCASSFRGIGRLLPILLVCLFIIAVQSVV